jgi:hypothetical protein
MMYKLMCAIQNACSTLFACIVCFFNLCIVSLVTALVIRILCPSSQPTRTHKDTHEQNSHRYCQPTMGHVSHHCPNTFESMIDEIRVFDDSVTLLLLLRCVGQMVHECMVCLLGGY